MKFSDRSLIRNECIIHEPAVSCLLTWRSALRRTKPSPSPSETSYFIFGMLHSVESRSVSQFFKYYIEHTEEDFSV